MANSGDHGDLGLINCIGHPFVVEGPKVFDAAAASAHDQQISQLVMVGISDGSRDLTGSFRTLDTDRQQLHMGQRVTLTQDPQHIVHRRTGGTGDDTNSAGILRQRLLMGRIKQPLGSQFLLQLLKGGIEITHAVHSHGSAVKLIGAVSGINGDLAHSNDLHTVFRTKPQAHGIAFEHHTLQRAALILQCEIMMAGRIHFVVADLTADSHLVEQGIRVHFTTNVFIQLGNGQHILCHFIPPSFALPEPQRPWHCP